MPLPALIGLAASAALTHAIPAAAGILGRLIAGTPGPNAREVVGGLVVDVAREVVGGQAPDPVQAALADPAKAGEVLIRLETIQAEREKVAREAEVREIEARLADVANARDAGTKSTLIAWTQVSFAVVILGIFATAFLAPLFTGRPIALDQLMTGTLVGTFATVFGFFFGNATAANTANAAAGKATAAAAALVNRLGMGGGARQERQEPAAIATTGSVTVHQPGAAVAPPPAPPEPVQAIILPGDRNGELTPDELMARYAAEDAAKLAGVAR